MNIYEKLQTMRSDLQKKKLKKTGKNSYSGYDYFELSDLIPSINEILLTNKCTSILAFTPELATLKIIDAEKPEDFVEFTSPMSTANLKGNHEVQNLGAVETYIRRYLYTNAFEIVESDALDSTSGKPSESPKKPVTQSAAQLGVHTCKQCGSTNLEQKIVGKGSNQGRKYWKCIDKNEFSHWVTEQPKIEEPVEDEINLDDIPF